MSDTVHAGDLAEYTGRQKNLRGRRCDVQGINPISLRATVVVSLADGRTVWRAVKPKNLKRLGGGCLKAGMRDEG